VRIRVLGSAAGGGFPQWNCRCSNCEGVRQGRIRARARTQESVAVSADGDEWFLLNASPEIRAQIESFVPLHPRAPRHTPIAGILLTNGDLDHCLGLLCLRESQPLTVYATDAVRRGFVEDNTLYATLQRFPGQVSWQRLTPGDPQPLTGSGGRTARITVEAIAVAGQPPLHLRERATPSREDNIALKLTDERSGATLCYMSGVAAATEQLLAAVADASAIFFDGTFWSSDELIRLGLGSRRAEEMAHWPIGGPAGSLRALVGIARGRRIYIHINNTNPILREDSPEYREVTAAGWEVAHDGLEVEI
jgi:pyrroloquinoline quinone biosynthesis protein B